MGERMTEAQVRAGEMLRQHWDAFCDGDRGNIPADFEDTVEAAGLIEMRAVTEDDLDDPFAAERGIEAGGSVWCLTPAGLAYLASMEKDHA